MKTNSCNQGEFAFMPSEWWMVTYHTSAFVEAPDTQTRAYLFATREEARRAAARIIRICRRDNPAAKWRPEWRGYDAMEYATYNSFAGEPGGECVCVELCDTHGNGEFFGRKI